jgi:hypothetical protein
MVVEMNGSCQFKVSAVVRPRPSVFNKISDIPDQAAIVRQYMRFTSQIESGKVATQVVHRALQMCIKYALE